MVAVVFFKTNSQLGRLAKGGSMIPRRVVLRFGPKSSTAALSFCLFTGILSSNGSNTDWYDERCVRGGDTPCANSDQKYGDRRSKNRSYGQRRFIHGAKFDTWRIRGSNGLGHRIFHRRSRRELLSQWALNKSSI